MKLGIPRAEMLARMTSVELSEWVAFANLEPFGAEADYLGHAIVASTVANRHRGKNERAHKVEEFLPRFEQKPKDARQMLQFAEVMTAALGGKDLRGDG